MFIGAWIQCIVESMLNELCNCVKYVKCEIWWMKMQACLEVNVKSNGDYVKGVVICIHTHTHYEWKNEVMNVNGGMQGRHFSWVEMKCLDHSLLFL